MRVTLANGQIYLVGFANLSEALVHDTPVGPYNKIEVGILRERIKEIRKDPDMRRFLRIRPFKRISVITTVCTIRLQGSPDIVEIGHAYYSRAEVDAGIKFNKPKAWRMALGRAIKPFFEEDRRTFLSTFTDFLERREHQMVASAQERQRGVSRSPADSGPEGFSSESSQPVPVHTRPGAKSAPPAKDDVPF